jgi:hypothetical protein
MFGGGGGNLPPPPQPKLRLWSRGVVLDHTEYCITLQAADMGLTWRGGKLPSLIFLYKNSFILAAKLTLSNPIFLPTAYSQALICFGR